MLEWTDVRFVDDVSLRLVASDCGIRAIEFTPPKPVDGHRQDGNPLLREAASQLRAYFAGDLRRFHLPLDMHGTEFQKRVWRELARFSHRCFLRGQISGRQGESSWGEELLKK
jgi:hypothetical protein